MRLYWVKCAVSVMCLGAVLWWSDTAGVWARLQDVNPTWIALALMALTAATFAMASRWKMAGIAFGVSISYPLAVREYYLAQLINMALPGGVAGDVTRAVRIRHTADLTRAAQSVMAERLLGQIAILVFLFGGLSMALVMPGGPDWGLLGWVALAVLVGCAIGMWMMSRADHATGRFLRLTTGLMQRPAMILHGVITTACLIFGFYACARATGVTIPPADWATLIPLVLCAMLIPLSVGGWGWREGAAAALFPLIGAPASAGIATGITYGLVLGVATLPAGAILLVQTFSTISSTEGKPDIP